MFVEITSKKFVTSNKQTSINFVVLRLITRFCNIDDTFVTRSQSTIIRFFFASIFISNVLSITQSNNFSIINQSNNFTIFEFVFVLRLICSIKVIIDTFDISIKKIIHNQLIKSQLSLNRQNQNQKQNQQIKIKNRKINRTRSTKQI